MNAWGKELIRSAKVWVLFDNYEQSKTAFMALNN